MLTTKKMSKNDWFSNFQNPKGNGAESLIKNKNEKLAKDIGENKFIRSHSGNQDLICL